MSVGNISETLPDLSSFKNYTAVIPLLPRGPATVRKTKRSRHKGEAVSQHI